MVTSERNIQDKIITLYRSLSVNDKTDTLSKLLDTTAVHSSRPCTPEFTTTRIVKRELSSPDTPFEGGSRKVCFFVISSDL
jgi:hypothetical protein